MSDQKPTGIRGWSRSAVVTLAIVTALGTAAIVALLVNIMEKKSEAQNTFFRVVELTDDTEDPAIWGKNFPLQYDAYLRTVDQQRTRYGGSEAMPRTPTEADPRSIVAQSRLDEDPRLKTMWAGYAFATDFRKKRGHAYMLEDQTFTERVQNFKQPGTCIHCHGMIRPARVSLAHHGVLFLDEAPEFNTGVLEALRQSLESGQVTISRASKNAWFPARFQLVLAMNPCPCGRSGPDCSCVPAAKRRYAQRVSAPIRDRIDINRVVRALGRHQVLDRLARPESSDVVAGRVAEARDRQRHRLAGTPWRRNADVPGGELRRRWPVDPAATAVLQEGNVRGRVSARGMDRVVRIAWTLADLAGVATPGTDEVAIALALRREAALPAATRRPLRLTSHDEVGTQVS